MAAVQSIGSRRITPGYGVFYDGAETMAWQFEPDA